MQPWSLEPLALRRILKPRANSHIKTQCIFHFSKIHYCMPGRILLFVFFFFLKCSLFDENVQSQDRVFLLEIIWENSLEGGHWEGAWKTAEKEKKCNFSIIFLAFEHLFVVWSRQLYGFFTRTKGKVWINVSLGKARAECGWYLLSLMDPGWTEYSITCQKRRGI